MIQLVVRMLHLQFFSTPVDHGLELDRGFTEDKDYDPVLDDDDDDGLMDQKRTCWPRTTSAIDGPGPQHARNRGRGSINSPATSRGARDPTPAFGPLRRLLAQWGLAVAPRRASAVQRETLAASNVANDSDGVIVAPGSIRSSFVFDSATLVSYHADNGPDGSIRTIR